MTKEEFVDVCKGVGVYFNPLTLRIYRNFTYSHQIAYATVDFDGNIQRVILMDAEVDHPSHKALRTLIMVHGLKKDISTNWGRQMG